MIKFSRSAEECFRRCPRQYYYAYGDRSHNQPTPGYESKAPSLPLLMGLSVHKGMEVLFKTGQNLDSAIAAAIAEFDQGREGRSKIIAPSMPDNYDYFLEEQRSLIAALLMGWRILYWESFNTEYEILQIEQEIETGLKPGLYLQSRCDLVCRSRSDRRIWVPDWKCVGSARDWSSKWQYEQQTLSQAYAISSHFGEEIAGSVYWALVKGGRKDGRQLNPLIYGYKHQLESGHFEYACEYRKGWEVFPVWAETSFGPDRKQRLRYWLHWLPEEIISSRFPQSPPILYEPQLAQDWIESSIQHQLNMEGAHFSRNQSYWTCKNCAFKGPCLNNEPLDNFIPRVDHHSSSPAGDEE